MKRVSAVLAAIVSAVLTVTVLGVPGAFAEDEVPSPDAPLAAVVADEESSDVDEAGAESSAADDSIVGEAGAEAVTCKGASTTCFRLGTTSGRGLFAGEKYQGGSGRKVSGVSKGVSGGADWRIIKESTPVIKDGVYSILPGQVMLNSFAENGKCLDTRNTNVEVVLWGCKSKEKSRQWWYFQLASDEIMRSKGQVKPAASLPAHSMYFFIRNAEDKHRCLTALDDTVKVVDCAGRGTGGIDNQLFRVTDQALADKIKQLAVDYQSAACSNNKDCEILIRTDPKAGKNPDPILAYGCAAVAQGTGGSSIVKNDGTSPITYEFTSRVSESHKHSWNFGVNFTVGSGALQNAINNYSLQLQADYGGEWSKQEDEEHRETRVVQPGTYAWKVRGVPQLPTLTDVEFSKIGGMGWTVTGTGRFMVNGNDTVEPILVYNEAPTSIERPPTCETLGPPRLKDDKLGPQILKDGRNLGVTPPAVGDVLTATTGEWHLDTGFTYQYQWFAGKQQIQGATSQSYTVVENDVGSELVVQVTTKRKQYIDGRATSEPTAAVVAAPDPGTDPGEPEQPGEPEPPGEPEQPGEPEPPGEPGDVQELELRVHVSSLPHTPDSPPFFTAQVLLPDRSAVEVPGTVRAMLGDRELVARAVTLKGGRSMATLELPQGALSVGTHTIDLRFAPDDTSLFAEARSEQTVEITE